MKISVSGAFRNFETNYGYGVAAKNILNGFTKNNLDWYIDHKSADIEIFWGHPPYEFQNYSRSYKIGYTAWESTEFKDGWLESMDDVDELWSPSYWLSDLFAEKTGKPTFTYEHGVSKSWKPKRHYRDRNRPFTFLHIGEPQFRKNGQLVVDAFAKLFGGNEDYKLVMKSSGMNTTRIWNESGNILGTPQGVYKNIILLEQMMEEKMLIELHNKVDCLIYPTSGEGFGFHPLEAMASGLPTITTTGWCNYKKFITLELEDKLSPSEYSFIHPGNMFNPNFEDVKNKMLEMVENYEKYAKLAFKNSLLIHDEYDWDKVNYKAVKRLKEIYKSKF